MSLTVPPEAIPDTVSGANVTVSLLASVTPIPDGAIDPSSPPLKLVAPVTLASPPLTVVGPLELGASATSLVDTTSVSEALVVLDPSLELTVRVSVAVSPPSSGARIANAPRSVVGSVATPPVAVSATAPS